MCADQGVQGLKNAGHRADADANIVTAHKRAGFVMTGRTNTPEIGLAATTEPIAYGTPAPSGPRFRTA